MTMTTSIEGFYRGFAVRVREGADGNWTATARLDDGECGNNHVASEREPTRYAAMENLRHLIDEILKI